MSLFHPVVGLLMSFLVSLLAFLSLLRCFDVSLKTSIHSVVNDCVTIIVKTYGSALTVIIFSYGYRLYVAFFLLSNAKYPPIV